MGTISTHFSFHEFEKTNHQRLRVKNTIASIEVRDNIQQLVWNILQPLRNAYGKPMQINSGYRCKELNDVVGGVPTSQHCKGQAADIRTGSPKETFALAKLAEDMLLPYDQMILYPTFVHFSYRADGQNRHELLYNKSYKGRRL